MARKCEPVLPREFLPLISSLRTLRSRRQRYIASSASTALTKAGWISPREASKKPTPSSLLKCCFWTRCPPLAPPLPDVPFAPLPRRQSFVSRRPAVSVLDVDIWESMTKISGSADHARHGFRAEIDEHGSTHLILFGRDLCCCASGFWRALRLGKHRARRLQAVTAGDFQGSFYRDTTFARDHRLPRAQAE